jgi:hypothetical protein
VTPTYYVARIEFTSPQPTSCITCGRDDLKSNVVITKAGSNEQNISNKNNILCLACETLMVITDEPQIMLTIMNVEGNKVIIRNKSKNK